MKFFIFTLIAFLFLSTSCKKNDNPKKNSSPNSPSSSSKKPPLAPQEPPEREIIDIKEDKYTVAEVLEIDKEIPVLEIILDKSWGQKDIEKLKQMQSLETLRFKDVDCSSFSFSFLNTIKSLTTLSFEKSKVKTNSLNLLKDSSIQKLELIDCGLEQNELDTLKALLKSVTITH